jgi:ABC-type transporter Mla MlaB component
MPAIADCSEQGTMRLRLYGSLDGSLGIDLLEAQYRFDDSMSTCVVDFAAVTRVRDTGMMMLRAFCDGLARTGLQVELRNGPSRRA